MIQNNPNQKKFLSSEDIDVVIEIVKKYNLGPTDLLDDPELEKNVEQSKISRRKSENNRKFTF
jgi:hypothetical protein